MATSEINIEEITDHAEFPKSAKIIRDSFRTVAEEFGLTRENAPTHPTFLTVRWLKEKKSGDVKFFGLFLVRQVPISYGMAIQSLTHHERDGKQIGFVIVEKESARKYWIEKLAVLPDYRHGGSGAKLVGFAIDYIRQQGGSKAVLGVMDEHIVLKDWYKKLGFKVTETREIPNLPFSVSFMERDTRPLVVRQLLPRK